MVDFGRRGVVGKPQGDRTADLVDTEHTQNPGRGVADREHTVFGKALNHPFGGYPGNDDAHQGIRACGSPITDTSGNERSEVIR